ncbi:MAG: curlin repeat-containing protein [Verrucomicrobiota bacterium]
MIKALLIYLVIIFFCFNATSNESGSGRQKIKEHAKRKTVIVMDTMTNLTDSVSAVSINGNQNSVRITTNHPSETEEGTGANEKNRLNTIEIDGEDNSVHIDQRGNGGKVSVTQSGNRNQVKIIQSNICSKK